MPENVGVVGFVGHFHPISITHAHARTHALYTARVNGAKQTHKTHITYISVYTLGVHARSSRPRASARARLG